MKRVFADHRFFNAPSFHSDWRMPQRASMTTEYATYVKIISWFLDTPSPLAPFGVHRMALAGKDLSTEIGCWFGPSTAAGAIRCVI